MCWGCAAVVQTGINEELCRDDFDAIPFMNADGYHCKTIAYSIWHIFRIEDIVAHILISENEQVFFSGNYRERINSPIITTGNELVNAVFKTLDHACRSKFAYKKQDTFISTNSGKES